MGAWDGTWDIGAWDVEGDVGAATGTGGVLLGRVPLCA